MSYNHYFKKYNILYLMVGVFFCFTLFSITEAQIPGFEQNLSIKVTPTTPSPNEEVVIVIESFITDLNRADITWLVNGETRLSGSGIKKLRIVVGDLGEETAVSIIIDTQEGDRIVKRLSFLPALVDLVLEADTYTPPFYKGKPLISSNNTLSIIALPQLTTDGRNFLDPKNLVYTWSRDRRILGSESGFGKQTLVIDGPSIFQDTTISVEVSSLDKSLGANKTISITPQDPEILFYEKHPLRGILYNKALVGTFTLHSDEFVLRAEPYFMSNKDSKNNLEYNWILDGKKITSIGRDQEITFRQTEGVGASTISLEINNIKEFLQGARNSLTLRFGLKKEFSF